MREQPRSGRDTSAADVDEADQGHHESVGERQGRQPAPMSDLPVAAPADCPTCHGASTVDPDPDCPTCGGEGEVEPVAAPDPEALLQTRLRVERKYANEYVEQKNSGHGRDVASWLASVSYTEWFALTDAYAALLVAGREVDPQSDGPARIRQLVAERQQAEERNERLEKLLREIAVEIHPSALAASLSADQHVAALWEVVRHYSAAARAVLADEEDARAENYDGPEESVECAYLGCTNRLLRASLNAPQFCSRQHRDAAAVEEEANG